MAAVNVVILAGGQGTRLAEETDLRPKPMVEIGGRPILWHIMKHYARHGFNEFVVALGYRGEDIKRFFLDYVSLNGDMTVRVGARGVERLSDRGRRLDGASRRHGRGHEHGRTHRPAAPLLAEGRSCSPTATASPTSIWRRCWPPPRVRQAGDGHGGATRVAVRWSELRRRWPGALHREAADRRRLGQRRVHGARARGPVVHRRRRSSFELECAGADLGGGPARRLPARGLLAIDGQHSRRPLPARAVGSG